MQHTDQVAQEATAVSIRWERASVPTLRVSPSPHGIEVVVDPRLNARQVARACAQLEADGLVIERAWRAAVGLPQVSPVS
jgi:hypothetical protein